MRRMAILTGLLLTTACDGAASDRSEAASRPAAAASTAPPATPPAAPPGRSIGTSSALSADVSPLSGAITAFTVERTDFGARVQLAADTLFEFDKADLSPGAQTNLARVAELVREGGAGAVTVIGHTDAKGRADYNIDLSKRRAEAVAAWLHAQPGLEARAITVEGRGMSEPIAPNTTAAGLDDPEGRARNRRVTIDIPGR